MTTNPNDYKAYISQIITPPSLTDYSDGRNPLRSLNMHYEIDYSKYMTLEEKKQACIDDIKEFLGEKRYNNIIGEFKKVKNMTESRFALYMSIAGVTGYPVKVLYEIIYGDKND